MTAAHLAQLNIARLRMSLDSAELADFVALLPEINALADGWPGFVWRLTDDTGGDATSLRPFGADIIVNLTVWESIEALVGYVYRSAHLEPLRRRREWFTPLSGPHLVLWWIPPGHVPTLTEAADRLATLARSGAGPAAFTLRERYPAPTGELSAP
jgi:hypothetical protein